MPSRFLLPNLNELEKQLEQPEHIGIFTDADGTLSEISGSPGAARVKQSIASTLEILNSKYGLVAVISGRRADEVKNLVGADGLIYIGNHGLETVHNGRLERDLPDPREVAALKHIKEALAHGLPKSQGLFIEDKEFGAAIHYRLCFQPAAIKLAKQLAETEARKHGLIVQHGRAITEIKPAGANKGTAVLRLVAERSVRQVIYLGDDYTDLDAFKALGQAAEADRIRAVRVAVVGDAEAPIELAEQADYVVESVAEVEEFLCWLAER